jgi:glycogen operon protein
VLQLVMDSLRYWVQEMHVDGFRFDLASALARDSHDVDLRGPFFDTIHQDPVLSQVKLIAEPWDVGHDGYQVGNFPTLWSEWNGPYRDALRRYWRGDDNQAAEMGYRLTGSSDLYEGEGRRPYASINFITAHDGFTLNDLVSYNEKHNEANGEDNRDGSNDNISNNWGAEGPTDNQAVNTIRERVKRSFLASLAFSQGVPMLLGGDEWGRSQKGNNNAYCQDSEISWFHWDLSDQEKELLEFSRRVFALRREHPALSRKNFFSGRPIHGQDIKDITWLRPDGEEMEEAEWETPWLKCFGLRLDGHLDEVDEQGEPVVDTPLLLLFNADSAPHDFELPPQEAGTRWRLELDTADPHAPTDRIFVEDETYKVHDRALVLLVGVADKDGVAG